jgi:predicted SAM-dependent methyltransferase
MYGLSRNRGENLMKINLYKKRLEKLLSKYGFGRGRKINISDINISDINIESLHIGCGNIHIKDWCNIDVLATGATDLICDITSLKGIPKNKVRNIYTCHVLEHFSSSEIVPILKSWYEVLEAGGELRISVPDLDAITKIYQDNIDHFQIPGHQPWIALIYGGQKDQYDFHKTGFNFCWLEYILADIGYENIERYPNEPHFIPNVVDNSIAKSFGEYISLNVVARKPLS